MSFNRSPPAPLTTTDQLPGGSTNLYFTDARVAAAVAPGVTFTSADADPTHFVRVSAADTMTGSFTFQFPAGSGSPGQSLILGGDSSTFGWYTPFTSASFEAYKTTSPMKSIVNVASTANISLAGSPGTVDGVDLSSGGVVLLKNQTDPSENGPWVWDGFSAWTREQTMPDDTSSTYGAIVPVIPGGTTTGNTIWYAHSSGEGSLTFVQIPTTNSHTPLGTGKVLKSGGGYLTESTVAVDGSANASASLEVTGTTGALLLSRVTTTQRNALTPVNGMVVYNTSTDKFQGYAAGVWADLN